MPGECLAWSDPAAHKDRRVVKGTGVRKRAYSGIGGGLSSPDDLGMKKIHAFPSNRILVYVP